MTKNKIKQEKYYSDEQMEIRKFIKILIIIVILILGIYFFSRIFISKDLFNKESDTPKIISGSINYDTTIIGAMLNKPETEYYVMLFDTKDPEAIYYSGLISSYRRNETALRVYTVDLSNELNKKYIKEENNLTPNDLDKFSVKDVALLKISKGKIIKSLSESEKIATELAYVKDTKK